MPVTTIPRNCLQCNSVFQAEAREVKRGNAKFCSLKCNGKFKTDNKVLPNPNVVCALCGIEFYKQPSKQKTSKSGLFFCTREHKDQAQRLGGLEEIMPSHYGVDSNYRKKAFEAYPQECRICGYNKYLSVLHVNHIDCDRTNNSLENLEILCPTHHIEFHYETSTMVWRKRNVAHPEIESGTEIL